MAEQTAIAWCDSTFNPWIGCTKVSPACDNCYSEVPTPARALGVTWGAKEGRHRTSAANWKLPLRWNAHHEQIFAAHGRRRRVFYASLADVFDNAVSAQRRFDLLRPIVDTPNLDWRLLTKRIGNATEMLEQAMRALTICREGWRDNYLPNVWIGATICNQEEADRDILKLLAVPARVRFLSMEPLLEPVDLRMWIRAAWRGPLPIGWVIVGCESGTNARPMHPAWARSLRDQCGGAGVPFLFKQWGEWAPRAPESLGYPVDERDGIGRVRINTAGETEAFRTSVNGHTPTWMQMSGKKAAGSLLDGAQNDGFPEAQ